MALNCLIALLCSAAWRQRAPNHLTLRSASSGTSASFQRAAQLTTYGHSSVTEQPCGETGKVQRRHESFDTVDSLQYF
eukprot:651742-Pleurochrysis_carterae.AAC.1